MGKGASGRDRANGCRRGAILVQAAHPTTACCRTRTNHVQGSPRITQPGMPPARPQSRDLDFAFARTRPRSVSKKTAKVSPLGYIAETETLTDHGTELRSEPSDRTPPPAMAWPPDVQIAGLAEAIAAAVAAAIKELDESDDSLPALAAVLHEMSLKLEDHACRIDDEDLRRDLGREPIRRSLAAAFAPNERIMRCARGTLVDATVKRHQGGTRFVVEDQHTGGLHKVELHPAVSCCKQLFPSAKAFMEAAAEYFKTETENKENACVEDGITGERLSIAEQLLYITTESESGKGANGTFFNADGEVLGDGSRFALELTGKHKGKQVVAFGPKINISEHLENNYEYSYFKTSLRSEGEPCMVQLEGPPSCCRLIKVDTKTGNTMEGFYLNASGNLRERRDGDGDFACERAFGCDCHFDEGEPPLKEHREVFCFNADGTISLHSSSPNIVQIEDGKTAEDFVIGYAKGRDGGEKHFMHVLARDRERRVTWKFTFAPEVSGVQMAEWLSITDVRQLVPMLLRESADRASGIHDAQPLLFRAGPGTGKTWSMKQLYFLLIQESTSRRPWDGVPFVPLLVVVQKLALLMRAEMAKNSSTTFDGDLLSLYIDSEFKSHRAQQVLHQARKLRALIVLFDGVDEASDLKLQVEDYVVKQLCVARALALALARALRPHSDSEASVMLAWSLMHSFVSPACPLLSTAVGLFGLLTQGNH